MHPKIEMIFYASRGETSTKTNTSFACCDSLLFFE